VIATDVDHGAVLTYALIDAPFDGLTFAPNGGYTFDPTNKAYDHLAEGAKQDLLVHYRATDEHGASSDSTLTITITGTNDAPVAMPDVAATGENQPLAIDVLANDTDVDDGHSFTLVSANAPSGKGSAVVVDGKVAFDPGTDFDHLSEGETETIQLAYSMTDEHHAPSSSTVALTIIGANDAPTAVPDIATTDEDHPVAIVARDGRSGRRKARTRRATDGDLNRT